MSEVHFQNAGHIQLHVFWRDVTAEIDIDEVLRELVIPFFQENGKIAIFHQDNAKPHTVNRIRIFLNDQTFKALEWPSNSLELNPNDMLA